MTGQLNKKSRQTATLAGGVGVSTVRLIWSRVLLRQNWVIWAGKVKRQPVKTFVLEIPAMRKLCS